MYLLYKKNTTHLKQVSHLKVIQFHSVHKTSRVLLKSAQRAVFLLARALKTKTSFRFLSSSVFVSFCLVNFSEFHEPCNVKRENKMSPFLSNTTTCKINKDVLLLKFKFRVCILNPVTIYKLR